MYSSTIMNEFSHLTFLLLVHVWRCRDHRFLLLVRVNRRSELELELELEFTACLNSVSEASQSATFDTFGDPSANTHAAGGVCSWAYAQNALRTIRDMASICLPRQQTVHFAHLGPHLGHVPRQQPTGHCYEYVRIACAEAVQPGPSLQRLCSARLARRGFHSNDELDESPTTDRQLDQLVQV